MITNLFEYMDSDAKDIQTHRKNIVALDGEESLERALTFMLEENKSRFPVYEEDIDNLWGFFISGMRCRATWTVRQGKNRCMI